ncbi:MAG: DEAD/DEAH box helicase [Candidatus Thorarchaeota archaeon]
MKFELYEHQQKAVDDICGELMFGAEHVVLDAKTSFGKSFVTAGLCRELSDENIVIIVNITELIDQIAEHLDHFDIDYSILKSGRDAHFDANKRVQLVMAQTLYSRLDKINLSCDLVIQDEIHREFDTKRTSDIIAKLKPSQRIGLSGTPFDSDSFALKDVTLVETKSIIELEDEKFITPVKYFIPKWSAKIDYSKVKMQGSEYNMASLDKIVNTDTYLDQVVGSMNSMNAKDKKTIIFCSSIEQCDSLTAKLVDDGYLAQAIHSKIGTKENKSIIDSFRNNSKYISGLERKSIQDGTTLFNNDEIYDGKYIRALVSVSKLAIGFDVKDIQLGVMARKVGVLSLYHQLVGRIIRPHESKQFAELLDLGSNVAKHGFHSTPFSPLKRSGDEELDKATKVASDQSMGFSHMDLALPDELSEFDIDKYNLVIKKLETKQQEINDKKADISTWSMKELASAFSYTSDVFSIVKIGAQIMTMKFGSPISKRGFPYNYDPSWIAEDIIANIEKYPNMKTRWTNAYRTRTRNIIKQEKNFNGLKFFADFLLKDYEESEQIAETYRSHKSEPSDMPNVPSPIDLDIECPF